MPTTFYVQDLQIKTFEEPTAMGAAAAHSVQELLNVAINKNGFANLILATGTSQFSFLKALQNMQIDWNKVSVFHLDEYVGISENHPASFRKYLKERIIDSVKPKHIYYLNGDAKNLVDEIDRYTKLLQDHPIDVACIGIGENGHIAFNDPPVADFNDPVLVKKVELDDACRKQQLGEGWFPNLDDVPKYALTLTIPAILNSKSISCVVPDTRKAETVHNTLFNEISTACPATILRTHPDTIIYLDTNSASLIENIDML